MKSLIDVRLLTRGGVSGFPSFTRNVVRELIIQNPEHQFILFYNAFRVAKIPSEWLEAKNVRVINWHIPNRLLNLVWNLLALPKIDWLIDCDLIYSPNVDLIETGRTPRVMTVHDLSFLYHPYFFSRRQLFWHSCQRIRRQIKSAARVIAVSEYTKKTVIEKFDNEVAYNTKKIPVFHPSHKATAWRDTGMTGERTKVEVVYQGITEDLKLESLSRPEEINEPFFLYLGTFEPRKNVPLIILAFNEYKKRFADHETRLVLAGGLGWLYQEILDLVKKSPYKNEILILNQVSEEKKKILYNAAIAFIFPSFFEGFGLPPIEAQKCQCPVIASNRTSFIETLGQSAVLVDPWNVSELAGAMHRIKNDLGLRKNLIFQGQKNAERFSFKKTAADLMKIFLKVYDENHRL